MTRIQQSKTFLLVIFVGFIAFVGANFYFLGPVKGLASVFAIQLFIIWNNLKQKKNLKTFNVARKLQRLKRYDEAITMFLTYLKEVKDHPEKEKTTLLNFGVYTHSTVAMSYNNIGACCIEMGYYGKAVESLERAVEVDVDYAIPYYNLSLIAALRGEDELVNRYFEKLHSLGYKVSMTEVSNKIKLFPEEKEDTE